MRARAHTRAQVAVASLQRVLYTILVDGRTVQFSDKPVAVA